MAFDVDGARKAGYSDAEIADFLGSEQKYDVGGARKAGYSDSELIQHLSAPAAAPPPKATKQGLLDRAKGMVSEGKANLGKELDHPLDALGNLAKGVGKGLFDVVDGGAQLAARGANAAANAAAPGSALAKWTQGQLKEVEAVNDDREDKYQAATKGSVLAGVGRVGGNAILPVGNAVRLEKGATLLAKAGSSSAGGAAIGALQPVYHAGDDFAKDKAIQVAGGAVLGAAAPVAGRVGLEALSKLGSTKAEQALVNTRKAQLFDKSPNAKADAEVITELGGVDTRIGGRKVITNDINARAKKMYSDAEVAHEGVGATPEQMRMLANWQGLTEAERAALPKSTRDIIAKFDRVRALTPGELSSNALGPVRAAVDLAPIPAPMRWGLRNLLGGRVTRNENAASFLDDRSQNAARQFLAENGPSDATQAINGMKGIAAQRKAAQDALEAAKAAAAAKDAVAQDALKLKARKVSGTPGGGAYQALLEHTGLAKDDLNTALRAAQKIPEAADAIRAIRVGGGNTKDGAIYPVTDIVNTIADGLGMSRGVLTQAPQAGALSAAAPTANQILGKDVRQKVYDDLIRNSGGVQSTAAREAVRETARKLKSTPKINERASLIDSLESAYPEAAGVFDTVRTFK